MFYFVIVLKYWKRKTKYQRNDDLIRALGLSVNYYKYKDFFDKEIHTFAESEKYEEVFDIQIIHYFNEFQVCYRFIDILHSLLGHPIGKAEIHRFLNGYLISLIMTSNNNPDFNTTKTITKSILDFINKNIV